MNPYGKKASRRLTYTTSNGGSSTESESSESDTDNENVNGKQKYRELIKRDPKATAMVNHDRNSLESKTDSSGSETHPVRSNKVGIQSGSREFFQKRPTKNAKSITASEKCDTDPNSSSSAECDERMDTSAKKKPISELSKTISTTFEQKKRGLKSTEVG
ncbi:hypothetical protein QAD02_007238 [Eretmocerus hayati]|uniref:Uncharacterized protein n=1 Tax=Eretmocerus hayati TaxID=131215 RepID=A0ACC2N4G0_9HYME|nr:hypothetical protein QAD02_007238 [Eretmocerus hayati]